MPNYWEASFNTESADVMALPLNGNELFYFGSRCRVVGAYIWCDDKGANTNGATMQMEINSQGDLFSSNIAIDTGFVGGGVLLQNNLLEYNSEIKVKNPQASGVNNIGRGKIILITAKY